MISETIMLSTEKLIISNVVLFFFLKLKRGESFPTLVQECTIELLQGTYF